MRKGGLPHKLCMLQDRPAVLKAGNVRREIAVRHRPVRRFKTLIVK
jgi:hypothetical protein